MPIQPSPPTAKGPAEWFTGDVWMTPSPAASTANRKRMVLGSVMDASRDPSERSLA